MDGFLMVLKWIGLGLLGIFAGAIGLLVSDAVRRRALWKSTVRCTLTAAVNDQVSDTLIVYVPGILADGVKSSDPVRAAWLKFGDVMHVSYVGNRFDGSVVANHIARDIVTLHNSLNTPHRRIVFILSSMGGMLGLDVLEKLDHMRYPITDRRLVLVDAPSGSQDMLSGGNIFAPLMRVLPFGPVYNVLLAPLKRKMLLPPKDDSIEDHLDKELVKKTALENMDEFPVSVWRDQLVYMATYFFDREKLAYPAIYLRCDEDNVTVKQPQAAQTWSTIFENMKIVPVASPHCAYAERQRSWQKVFTMALDDLLVRR